VPDELPDTRCNGTQSDHLPSFGCIAERSHYACRKQL
jgi:hypothetical protein